MSRLGSEARPSSAVNFYHQRKKWKARKQSKWRGPEGVPVGISTRKEKGKEKYNDRK